MGWYYGCTSRRAQIQELTAESASWRTLRKFTSGNTLWVVHELKQDVPSTAEGATAPAMAAGKRFIGCYLMQRAGKNDWGYKPLEESMHPYYYTCPLAFLELAPVECQAWRDGVRAHHVARNARLAPRREYFKRHRAMRKAALAGNTQELERLRVTYADPRLRTVS